MFTRPRPPPPPPPPPPTTRHPALPTDYECCQDPRDSTTFATPQCICLTAASTFCFFCFLLVGWVLLYVHRNHRLIRDGSPGRPPRLSHSSWTLLFSFIQLFSHILFSPLLHSRPDRPCEYVELLTVGVMIESDQKIWKCRKDQQQQQQQQQ